MTRICQLICSSLNVMFCDHIIVARDGMYSYYGMGEMQRIARLYSVRRLAEEKREKREKYLDEVRQDFPNVFKKDITKFAIEKHGDTYVGVLEE